MQHARPAPLLLALLLLTACSKHPPPEVPTVIAVQTVQDPHNSVPLTESKMTLFLSIDGSPVTVLQDGRAILNPVPAKLARGSVDVQHTGGTVTRFHFHPVAPLNIQLLPVLVGGEGPTITPADLAELEAAILQQLPFNRVQWKVLAPSRLPGVGVHNLWQRTLTLTKRFSMRDTITVAVLPFVPGQEYNGWGTPGRAALMLHHAGGQLAVSTFLHELGHALGASHAPCGAVANPDPGYPTRDGRVPDIMLDNTTGQLIKTNRFDLMSYCHPKWPSAFTTLKIIN